MSVAATVALVIARLEEDGAGLDTDTVSPGVAGFVVTAVVALAVIFLGWDLVRRLRRGRYREEIRQNLAEELAEHRARESGSAAEAGAADSAPDDDRRD